MAQQYSPLRILARAYSDGKIEKEKYRTDRASFFEALIAGNVTLPTEEDLKERIARGDTFSDITLQKIKSAEKPATAAPKQKEPEGLLQNKAVLIGGGAGVLVIIIILIAVMSGGDETPSQPQQASQDEQESPAVVVDAPPTPLQNHLTRFLSANRGSEANLNAFLIEWQSFSQSDQAAAMNSIEFSRLVNAISKKLLEERALAAIGNPETSYEKQRQLVEFADSIGISDQRISLPEAPDSGNM